MSRPTPSQSHRAADHPDSGPTARSGSSLYHDGALRVRVGDVDLARGLVAAGDHEQASERDVLSDHHAELGDLGVREALAQLGQEGRVDRPEVRREALGEAHRERLPRREPPLRLGPVDLPDRLLVESLTRRRRVACEQSGVAPVERGDAQARELLDPRGQDPLAVADAEEREVALEEVGDQPGQVERLSGCRSESVIVLLVEPSTTWDGDKRIN